MGGPEPDRAALAPLSIPAYGRVAAAGTASPRAASEDLPRGDGPVHRVSSPSAAAPSPWGFGAGHGVCPGNGPGQAVRAKPPSDGQRAARARL